MPIIQNQSIIETLRRGQCVRDAVFDSVYPQSVQTVSARFWTPVSVALTAAEWLRDTNCQSLLDVGAGAGKLCIVMSLAAGCTAQGIEQRGPLVEAARAAATSYEADAIFEHGTLQDVDPDKFSAFYLYNPFGENNYSGEDRFDNSVELSPERCARDLATVEAWLDRAARGTCVLTYHGFGGRMPDTYTLVRSREQHGGGLRLWVKRRAGAAHGFTLDLGEVIVSSVQLEKLWERLTPSCSERVRELLDRPWDKDFSP